MKDLLKAAWEFYDPYIQYNDYSEETVQLLADWKTYKPNINFYQYLDLILEHRRLVAFTIDAANDETDYFN